MSTKIGVSCDIYTHVLKADPEFAEFLRGTCTEDALRPGRRSSGTTFLLPDKSNPIRKELEKLSTSDNPDDMRKAADIILALIVRDYIMTPDGWKKGTDIPNSMYPSRKIVVKKIDGQNVVLEGISGDATIKKDASFKDGSRKRNLAVWIVSGSGVSVTTPEAARPVISKGAKKTGNYQPTEKETERLRFQIGVIVENEAAKQGMTNGNHTVLHKYAMGLVKYLKDHSAEHGCDFYNDFFPVVSCSAADFYIFLEPHTPRTPEKSYEFLVPDDLIESWWNSGSHEFEDINLFCEDICRNMPREGYFSAESRKVLLDAINDERFNCDTATPPQIVERVLKFASTNQVRGKKLWPEGAASRYYNRHPAAKIVHDELRYSIVYQTEALSQLTGMAFINEFRTVIQWIAQLLHTQKPAILRDENKLIAGLFVNSDCFLYVYMTKDEHKGLCGCTADPKVAQEKSRMFDATVFGQELYKRLAGNSTKFDDIIANLKKRSLNDDEKKQIRDLVMQPQSE